METVKVRWINFTGQEQERMFTEKHAEKFIAMLKSTGLPVLSKTKLKEQ